MSGGSWDYVSHTFEDIGLRLHREQRQNRRGLGRLVMKVAKALHAIEWNDSGDGADDEEQLIRECFSECYEVAVLDEALEEACIIIIELARASDEAKKRLEHLKKMAMSTQP